MPSAIVDGTPVEFAVGLKVQVRELVSKSRRCYHDRLSVAGNRHKPRQYGWPRTGTRRQADTLLRRADYPHSKRHSARPATPGDGVFAD